jgi:hypothetical protein
MEAIGRDGENTRFIISLPALTNQILSALAAGQEQDGLMIYWVHGANIFDYLFSEDDNYFVEMSRLRNELRLENSTVSEVVSGEPLSVNEHTLYPIDVMMPGRECYPYILLRQDGQFDHSLYTPYLFKTIEMRDRMLRWLNQN